jgi:AcrR family transcriptional regulator
MPDLVSEPRTRMTQEQRRNRTRGCLLDATLASLVELGYSGTTTLEVERRAGVSRGARIHYFPSKAALLAAAVEHLYDQLSERYAAAFSQARRKQSARERMRTGLHKLWSIYERPAYAAALALTAAASNDPELRLRLRAVAERHRALARAAAGAYFPELSPTLAESFIETIHAAFVGLRTQGDITTEPRHVEMVLIGLEEMSAAHLSKQRTPNNA